MNLDAVYDSIDASRDNHNSVAAAHLRRLPLKVMLSRSGLTSGL